MTILVTGASGFLGGALAQALEQRGETVRILARKTSRLAILQDLPLEIVYGSLEERESLTPALRGVKTVYHCGGLSTDWAPWENFYHANVVGVKNMLDAALAAGTVERFLYISTTDVYGYPRQACDETHPITDVGLPYNRSKGQGEQAVWEVYHQTGLPVTILRPADIYGPRSQSFVVEIVDLLRQGQLPLFDGGRSHAGLLYIDNAVEAIIQAAASPHAIGQAYNLRDASDETWRVYFDALAAGLGLPAPRFSLPGGLALALARWFEIGARALRQKNRPLLTRHAIYLMIRDQGYPIAKAQRDFGFQSHISFAEGVARTIAWVKYEFLSAIK